MSVKTARRVSPAGRLLQMGDKFSEILRLRAGVSAAKQKQETARDPKRIGAVSCLHAKQKG
ncbi:MAG: hypothetical protein ACLR1P_00940 [Oscillospiraceae bacterium]